MEPPFSNDSRKVSPGLSTKIAPSNSEGQSFNAIQIPKLELPKGGFHTQFFCSKELQENTF